MIKVSREEFEDLVERAIQRLPKTHRENLKNIAFIVEDEPNQEQRVELQLRNDQSLLGLYQGVPLSRRQGQVRIYPDKITIFQTPIEEHCDTLAELREQIGRTVWHEVAHYYGLNHEQIGELEAKEKLRKYKFKS